MALGTSGSFVNFWSLDPEIVFLNHGSFGACPLPVLAAQQQFREQLEREPVRFFGREYEPLLDAARAKLAEFVGTATDEIAFVPNATTGVNTVLRSLNFKSGDELLTTSHEYNACRNALEFVAQRAGAKIVIAEIPFPIASPAQIIEAILPKLSVKTRLVLVDHITSQTGLIFPIQELAKKLSSLGIDILVDGAHAPGMIPLKLNELGATYYTGNCHKWLCAPKGAAFLYVHKSRQELIRPLTISHGANSPRKERSKFQVEFDWMGTPDPSAYLSVPVAIDFMESLLPGGWEELRAKNHELTLTARKLLCEKLKVPVPCPKEMIGSMASLPIPDGNAMELHDILFDEFGIESQIIPWPQFPGRLLRISAQIYNNLGQYEYLAESLIKVLAG
ncbi:aminotransferase class V-fold PLP-dependent enzyme [Ancylothrix sp. C2]|uniref:aminotransferase class V-fold PLP-dependent enzyme n=1 Tax=Ancylothrix sp. D3o TaxID=2953691 RepID=UPI0021BA5697|nr:aminotransferase class V-fold PLP-dependent enzyme [Ancylothrix sp. D3o]MCT7949648.1 aminotransferase class V-fold PLP-dependent enzyme [Ancylothrix sp. D3o]